MDRRKFISLTGTGMAGLVLKPIFKHVPDSSLSNDSKQPLVFCLGSEIPGSIYRFCKSKGIKYYNLNIDIESLQANFGNDMGTILLTGLTVHENYNWIFSAVLSAINEDIILHSVEESKANLIGLMNNHSPVFLVTKLNNTVANTVTPLISEYAKEENLRTTAVICMPFEFEGTKKITMAKESLLKINEHADSKVIYPSNLGFGNITLGEAHERAGNVFFEKFKETIAPYL